MGSRSGWVIASALVAVLLGACGGGAPSAEPTGSGASLEVLDVTVERAAERSTDFVVASSGERLAVGHRLRTDPTGFGELAYLDGSLARLGPDTDLTIVALSEDPEVVDTELDLDTGELWNRVAGVSETGGRYAVDTPVGTASVRGTVFSIVCRDDVCDFTVLEGQLDVELTLEVDALVQLGASQRVEITAGQPPPEPESVAAEELEADPWIAANLQRDAAAGLPAPTSTATATATADTRPTARVEGGFDVVARLASQVSHTSGLEPGAALEWSWEVDPSCEQGPCDVVVSHSPVPDRTFDIPMVFTGGGYVGPMQLDGDCVTADGAQRPMTFSGEVGFVVAAGADGLATDLLGYANLSAEPDGASVAAGCAPGERSVTFSLDATARDGAV